MLLYTVFDWIATPSERSVRDFWKMSDNEWITDGSTRISKWAYLSAETY